MAEKPADISDSALVAAFASTGDRAMLGELYRRYGHLVLGLCVKYLQNRDDAADAVSAIFMKLMTDLRKHRVEHFKSWLYVYSRNFCLMEIRKRSAKLRRDIELHEASIIRMDSEDSAHLNTERDAERLYTAIEALNDGQKKCIRLFYLGGKSYAEVASITGYSDKEVKSHIQNGKRNLRIKLEALENERREEG